MPWRSHSARTPAPKGRKSLTTGRSAAPIETEWVATSVPSTKKRTLEADHSMRKRCGSWSLTDGSGVSVSVLAFAPLHA